MADPTQFFGNLHQSNGSHGPESADDWPARATTAITQYVDSVRGKTTGPALSASRVVVYGIPIAAIAVIPLALLLIVCYRSLVIVTSYVPWVGEGETWLANFVLGSIFAVASKVLWAKKEQ